MPSVDSDLAWKSALSHQSSLWALWVAKDPNLLLVDSENWLDCANAQADPCLCWGYRLFCWFCHAAAQISLFPFPTEFGSIWHWQQCSWTASWQNQQNDYAPSNDSDQPKHLPSLIRVFTVCSMGSSGTKLSSCGQRRLWSDWADAQADLSLRWAHMPFVGFVICHVAAQLFVLEMPPCYSLKVTNRIKIVMLQSFVISLPHPTPRGKGRE